MVGNQAVARLSHRSGKKCPRCQPSIGKKFVRGAVALNVCQAVEYERKNQHCNERLQYCPESTQKRLPITNLDVAPDEKRQQLAINVSFFEINGLPALARLNGQLERGGHFSPGAGQMTNSKL